jgi:hypothetical protein
MKTEAKIVLVIALVLGTPLVVGWCATPAAHAGVPGEAVAAPPQNEMSHPVR